MLSADRAPENLAASSTFWLFGKGSVFADFSPVLKNRGNVILYCDDVTFRFAYLPVQHHLCLIVILENCVTDLDIAQKSRVAMFIMP